jgi:phospholipase/carboxylesterase
MTDADTILSIIELEPSNSAESCVIWLHGLGADGHDFESIVPQLDVAELNIRFIFPHAPVRPVSINAGMEMRAWYDIDPQSPLSGASDIAISVAQVSHLVERELEKGLSSEQIILAGFSQGGVIALELSLGYDKKLAGIMALSTYIHDLENLNTRLGLANTETPIFMAHGRMDPMIPIARAASARSALAALNYPVEWHEYPMGHQVCESEIRDISQWLHFTLSKTQHAQ